MRLTEVHDSHKHFIDAEDVQEAIEYYREEGIEYQDEDRGKLVPGWPEKRRVSAKIATFMGSGCGWATHYFMNVNVHMIDFAYGVTDEMPEGRGSICAEWKYIPRPSMYEIIVSIRLPMPQKEIDAEIEREVKAGVSREFMEKYGIKTSEKTSDYDLAVKTIREVCARLFPANQYEIEEDFCEKEESAGIDMRARWYYNFVYHCDCGNRLEV